MYVPNSRAVLSAVRAEHPAKGGSQFIRLRIRGRRLVTGQHGDISLRLFRWRRFPGSRTPRVVAYTTPQQTVNRRYIKPVIFFYLPPQSF